MLVNHTNSLGNRIGGAGDCGFFLSDKNLAFGGLVKAIQNIHQGGFSGSVFAKQGVDFTFFEGQIDIVVGEYAGELFGDPFEF